MSSYYSHTSRINNQTNLSDVKSKLESPFLSVSGHCHKMAGAPCITPPRNIFSLNFFNYNIIILPTRHQLQHLFDSHSIYITTTKHRCNFNLYLIFLRVVKFKFFLWAEINEIFPIFHCLCSCLVIHVLFMTKASFNVFQRAW